MADIKELVPPLELCKMIPAGEFADSVFCWIDRGHTCVLPDEVIPPEQHPFVELRRYTIQGDEIPAPTLKEIMSALEVCGGQTDTGWFCMIINPEHWSLGSCERDLYVVNGTESNSPEVSALQVWLKINGIEIKEGGDDD